jgi:hypothetical protein
MAIPVTGSQISMGRVNQAFSNWAPGAGGNANGTANPGSGGGNNIKLSAILGVSYGLKSLGAQISLSGTFGNAALNPPYTY